MKQGSQSNKRGNHRPEYKGWETCHLAESLVGSKWQWSKAQKAFGHDPFQSCRMWWRSWSWMVVTLDDIIPLFSGDGPSGPSFRPTFWLVSSSGKAAQPFLQLCKLGYFWGLRDTFVVTWDSRYKPGSSQENQDIGYNQDFSLGCQRAML